MRGTDATAADDDGFHVRISLGHRLARHPDGARSVLEDVGDGAADGEVAAEPLSIGKARGRAGRRPARRPRRRGRHRRRGPAPGPARSSGPACSACVSAMSRTRWASSLGPGDVRVEGHRPVDLDDVDGDDLGRGRASPARERGGGSARRDESAAQRHDGATEGGNGLVGHGTLTVLRVRPLSRCAGRGQIWAPPHDSTAAASPDRAAGLHPRSGRARGQAAGRRCAGRRTPPRAGTERSSRRCSAGRAARAGAGSSTGCRGSAPTSGAARTRGSRRT